MLREMRRFARFGNRRGRGFLKRRQEGSDRWAAACCVACRMKIFKLFFDNSQRGFRK